MGGTQQHFSNAAGLRKITGTGLPSRAERVAAELAENPLKIWWIYGDSTDGGTTPAPEVQTAIDSLLADGVPEDNISWLYRVGAALTVFTMAEMSLDIAMEGPTLQLEAGPEFTMAEMSLDIVMEGPTLSKEAGGSIKTTINGVDHLGAPEYSENTGLESGITMVAGNITVAAWVQGPEIGDITAYLNVDGTTRDSVTANDGITASKTLTYAVGAGVHSVQVSITTGDNVTSDWSIGSFSIPIP